MDNKYNCLLEWIQTQNVYDEIKKHEQELFDLIPELAACKAFKQNNDWHQYDVYEHILHVIAGTHQNMYLRLAALFHDIGKPLTYFEDANGVGHFYNHWNASIEIFDKYQKHLGLSEEEINLIKNLIFYHDINIDKLSNQDILNMVNMIGLENIDLLFDLKKADLLAQSSKYHYLLENINNQKVRIKNYKIN